MSRPRKTKFIRFIGDSHINYHAAELRAEDNGIAIVRHERALKGSGKCKLFESLDAAEAWIDSFELSGPQLLNKVLGELGVDGFPSN